MRKFWLSAALAAASFLVLVPLAHADFGFAPGSLSARAEKRDGTVDRQAGSHPYAFNLTFSINRTVSGFSEGGAVRDVVVDLPPGMYADPTAVPRCPRDRFDGLGPACPPSTQIGVARPSLPNVGEAVGPIYNLVPPPGVAVQFGFSVAELTALFNGSVRGEAGFGVRDAALNLPAEITAVSATIWGEPADSSHDSERGQEASEGNGPPVSSEAPLLPYLTLPTSCAGPQKVTVSIDSKLDPGAFVSNSAALPDESGLPGALTGCEAVPFSPTALAALTTPSSEGPSGLEFQLQLPNQGLSNPSEDAVTEAEPQRMEVALPQGITANPSAAQGLSGCSPSQIGLISAPGQVPARFDEALPSCPASSKLGTLTAHTPLLEEELEGSVYLAAPHDNPFGSLLALYVVARAPERGVLIKLAANASIDPFTGQITTTIDGMPPIPYSSVNLRLREGPRAPLITPQACGEYETTARLFPFSAPGSPVERSTPFKITSGANGSACSSSEAALPAHPAFEAGATAPVAGSYSPFLFKVSRSDGEQRLSSISATLPTGLLGKLKGIPYCPESGIATAGSRTAEGDGALEIASPSCPAASQVGTVDVSAGAGPSPISVQGKAYLAGPYKGAPLSLEIITPAVAGPFDLGSVAVRTALTVDPFTAQIHAASDPLPAILHGIPLDVRTVSLQMDRTDFTLNPTSCTAKTVGGAVTTLGGATASLLSPFAVGGCKGLEFQPKLQIHLMGATKRAGHPAVKATVTYPKGTGYANIATAQVGLPHSEFLDQGNLNKVCTQPDLKAGTCPKKAIYGKVKAWTPLLEKPLTGNVYLGVGFGYKLPAIVAELNGQIRVLLKGKVDTDKQGGIRNTFEAVPDAPVEKFVLELKGGKKYGLLENSVNICKGSHSAEVKFTGQNGKVSDSKVPLQASCKSKAKQ